MADGFGLFQKNFYTLMEEKKYEESLDLLKKEEGLYPDKAYFIEIWTISALCMVSKTQEALDRLSALITEEFWFSRRLLLRNECLDCIKDTDKFQAILTRIDSYVAKEKEKNRDFHIVKRNSQASSEDRYIILFHGNNGQARDLEPYFNLFSDLGYHLIALQAGEVGFSPGKYNWGTVEETATQVRELIVKYNICNFVLWGFSRGGELAVKLALNGMFPVKHAIAVSPAPLRKVTQWNISSEIEPDVLVVVGDEEIYRENVNQMIERIDGAGFFHQLHVLDGLSHGLCKEKVEKTIQYLGEIG